MACGAFLTLVSHFRSFALRTGVPYCPLALTGLHLHRSLWGLSSNGAMPFTVWCKRKQVALTTGACSELCPLWVNLVDSLANPAFFRAVAPDLRVALCDACRSGILAPWGAGYPPSLLLLTSIFMRCVGACRYRCSVRAGCWQTGLTHASVKLVQLPVRAKVKIRRKP